ncbi:MAG: peptidoglycan-binding protein, partial [Acetobacteraceae bacterium]
AGLGTSERVDDAAGLARVRRELAIVGYDVAAEGAWDAALGAVVTAFQRHWRGETVNGAADSGTRARLARLAEMTPIWSPLCEGATP